MSAAPAPKTGGGKSGDEISGAITTLQQQLKKQWMLLPATLIPGIICIAVASMWFPSIRIEARANPLIDIAKHTEAADTKAREIAGQQVKVKTRLTTLPLKPLREWQDPRIKIVSFLIENEQEHQIFMLRTLQGLRDLGKLMKGIDEWSYFKYTQMRRLIERSRARQQLLRDELEKLNAEQDTTRNKTPKLS